MKELKRLFHLRPGKLGYSFASATYSICMRVGGHYSLLTTSECYLHSANLRRYGHKSGRVTARKAVMTVDAAGLRGSGR